MAAIHGIGEAEASEDDSISLTSTVPSFHDEDEVYLIEDIVAERKTKHGLEYFVRWTGYPVERNSWEPRQNFQSDEILDEWQTRKMRISRGRESAFDIRAWEKRSEELEDAAEARRQRRERKRRRLNRLDDELDELSSVSVDEHAHVSVKDRAAKRNGSMSQRESSTSSYEEHPQEVIWTEEEKRALTKGLQDANGPNWRGILDWYGSSGSKSRVLNHKLVRDLKRKAAELRKEFVDAGREPPEWLKLRTIPRAKEPKIPKSKSRDALIKRRDSTASVDSLLEEIKQKSSKKAKGVLKGLPKQKEASCSIENQSVKAKSSTTDTSKDTVNVSKTTRTARAAESDPSKVVAQGAKHAESTSKRDGSDKQKGICGADQAPKKHVPIRKNVSGTVRPADMPASGPPQIQSGDRAIKRIATTGINTAPERGEPKATINSGIVRSATTPVSKSSGPQPVREGLKGSGNAKSPVENSSRSNPNTSRLVSSGPTKSSVEDSSRPKPSRPDPAGGRSAKSPVEDSTQPQPTRPGLVVLKLPRSPAEAASRPQPALLDSAGSKPAQPPVEASLQPIPARSGVPGSGPARSSSSKAKTSASSRNPTLTGIDMVMDRNAKPRFRGPESTATSKGVVEKPGKVWKMAVQNRVKKIRQLEPAPNPDHLIFVDPKTGKTPKASSSATAAAAGNQEVDSGITGKETGHLQVQQSEAASPNEDDMIIDSSELANASSRDIEARQDGVITSVVQARPISASVNQINKTPVSKLLSDPLAALPADSASLSTLSGPSPDTPVGPKRNLYDAYRPLKHPEINTNLTARPEPNSPSSHLSSFTLMTNPTYWQKQNVCRARDSTTIIGHLWLGAEVGPETIPKQDMLKVKFLGLDKQMHRELLKIKVQPTTMIFNFRKTCLASEYLHYFPTGPSDYFGNGYISPYPETSAAVEALAANLAKTLRGCVFFSYYFTMVMYPVGSAAWASLDTNAQKIPEGALLRFVVREPLPVETAEGHPAALHLANANTERFGEITNHVKANPVLDSEPKISVVFRDMFEIEYSRLIAQNGPQKNKPANVFFLCFIPQGCELYEPDTEKRRALRERTSREHDLFIEFLEANGAKAIYSMQDVGSVEIENNGAWNYFMKNVKSGTIIFHDACRVDHVPNLSKFLRNGAINVFKTSLSPMPAEQHNHLVRFFPHGGVILLTESLILYRPHEALRIIMWFRRVHLPSRQSGTWKLAARPRFREWLLDLLDLYEDTQKDVFGHGKQAIARIYTEILWLLENANEPLTYQVYDWDPELPTDEAPLVTSSSLKTLQARKEWKGETPETTEIDHYNIRQNDDLLIQWFAEWAMVHLDSFRKFHAVLGYPPGHELGEKCIKEYQKFWGHIEVLTADECFTRHSVTPQEKLDEMEIERRRKLRGNATKVKEENRKARTEERQTAQVALETRMQVYRDHDATEEEIIEAGRQFLREIGGSEKEIKACAVDIDRQFNYTHFHSPVERQAEARTSREELEADQLGVGDGGTSAIDKSSEDGQIKERSKAG